MELVLSRKGIPAFDSRYDIFKSLKGFEVHAIDESMPTDWPEYLWSVSYFSTYRKARAFVKSEIAMEIEDLG